MPEQTTLPPIAAPPPKNCRKRRILKTKIGKRFGNPAPNGRPNSLAGVVSRSAILGGLFYAYVSPCDFLDKVVEGVKRHHQRAKMVTGRTSPLTKCSIRTKAHSTAKPTHRTDPCSRTPVSCSSLSLPPPHYTLSPLGTGTRHPKQRENTHVSRKRFRLANLAKTKHTHKKN